VDRPSHLDPSDLDLGLASSPPTIKTFFYKSEIKMAKRLAGDTIVLDVKKPPRGFKERAIEHAISLSTNSCFLFKETYPHEESCLCRWKVQECGLVLTGHGRDKFTIRKENNSLTLLVHLGYTKTDLILVENMDTPEFSIVDQKSEYNTRGVVNFITKNIP
jgi:hypothetical protein